MSRPEIHVIPAVGVLACRARCLVSVCVRFAMPTITMLATAEPTLFTRTG
jgi:hypothetical protein